MSAAAPPIAELRADPPAATPLGAARGARRSGTARGGPGGRGALVVRLVACVALALFGARAWGDMVRPEADGRLLLAVAFGSLLGAGALLCGRLARPRRGLALGVLLAAGLLAALVCAGVPGSLLGPRAWDDLAGGLGEGIAALPGLSVPYRGVDEWNRIAMLLGGTLLAVLGPLLACWPGPNGRPAGPAVPAVMLAVLYAVPAIQLRADHPVLDGAIFALLLAAVLFAERVTRRDAPVVVPAIAAAALVGVVFAPRLDATDPWLDYESIAQSIGERGTTAFDWDHGYGPLDWPRDGREVLRIRASESAYWKATTLADFDGVRWTEVETRGNIEDDPAAEAPDPRWVRSLRVSVRNLRTRQFVTSGTTLRIERSPRSVVPGAPGSFVTGDRPLRRGHAYLARVYDPKPEPAVLAGAGNDYPEELWPYRSMQLPRGVGGPVTPNPATGEPDPDGPSAFVVFPEWGSGNAALGYHGRGYGEQVGERWVQDSAYARTYRLAQRLRAQSSSPYDYVRRVQSYLQDGFSYTESPTPGRVPLDTFLFEQKTGYCQQFSGAMALLLRMGGVPTRVASGFTPGTLDTTRNEYVVRDLDAHSWVEAYFPDIGWMTFDPTPAIAPPRAQAPGIEQQAAEDPVEEEEETGTAASERGSDPAGIDAAAAEEDGAGGPPVLAIAALTLAGLGLVAGLAALVVRRRRRRTMSVADHVAELERALRRSGRLPAQGVTLSALEQRLRGAPDAAAYVRTLRDGRYGWGGAAPSRAQRSALRRELGSGLGLRGRLRSLWALPPW